MLETFRVGSGCLLACAVRDTHERDTTNQNKKSCHVMKKIMKTAIGAPRRNRGALMLGVIFLWFSYYGAIGAKLNGQGEPCTKFMLLLA